MRKSIFLSGTIVVIYLILVGCNSGPSDEELAASVEARLATAQNQTAEALPAVTPSPISNEEEKAYAISTGEDGWQNYLYKEYGFSLSLPPQWRHLDLSTDDFDEMFSVASDAIPELGALFSSEYIKNLAAEGIKLIALDISPDSLGSGFPTSVNVLVVDLPMDIAFDDLVELTVVQLKYMFGEDSGLTQETRLLGGIEAEKIEYQAETNDIFGQPHNVTYQQYLMLDGRTQYVLTFGSVEDLIGQNKEIFSEISQSFELVN